MSLIFLLIIGGLYEFKGLMKKNGNVFFALPIILSEIIFISGIIFSWENWFELGMLVALFSFLLLMIGKYPKVSIEDISLNLLALLYIGWTLVHILLIRNLTNGFLLLILLFIIIWATDTGAYFSGRFFGKHKLALKLSPKKTVEGAIGGLLFSILSAVIFNLYYQIFSVGLIILIAFIISIMGQLGDLIESSLKRFVNIKDSGKIIPGHGGILDRFDSTITTAPILYYFVVLLQKWGVIFGQ